MKLLYIATALLLGCGGMEQIPCYTFGEDCPNERGETGPSGPIGERGQDGVTNVETTIIVRQLEPTGETDTPDSEQPISVGIDGIDGTSCGVVQTETGALITCEDGTSAEILNGTAGIDGLDGIDAPPTPYTIVGLIDPCGQEGAFDEVLLRLANGQLLAHYSAGGKQFLTQVGPGSYVVTDGTGCQFTVTEEMEVVW